MCFPSGNAQQGNINSGLLGIANSTGIISNLTDAVTPASPGVITQSDNPSALATQDTLEQSDEAKASRLKKRGRNSLKIARTSGSTGLNIPSA